MKSFWQQTALMPQSKNPPSVVDLVIIGGGLSGVSLAYWLMFYKKVKNILIIEKEHLGYGASGRNAGFLTRGSAQYFLQLVQSYGITKASEYWQSMAENHKLLLHHILGSKPNPKFDLKTQGSSTLCKDKEYFELLESQLISAKIEYKAVDIKSLSNSQIYNKALYLQDFESSINPLVLLHGIFVKTQQMNPELYWQQGLFQKFSKDQSHKTHQLKVHLKNQETINTKNIIIATNGYINDLDQMSINIKVNPILAQMQQIDFNTKDIDFSLNGNYYDPVFKIYFRQINSNQLIIGGLRQLDESNEVGTKLKINNTIQKALFQYAKDNIFGEKIPIQLKQAWCGVMGFTSSGHPIIEENPSNKDVYYFAGMNAHGLGLIFYHAKEFAEKYL